MNFYENNKNAPEGKSKLGYFYNNKTTWKPEVTAQYMNHLTRKQASIIFRTRTRMIKVKGNYKNGHSDLTCRACKMTMETQPHVLNECPKLHPDDSKRYLTKIYSLKIK